MIDRKLIGGILLIVGTSLGGAMLALPLSNAEAGFFDSTLLLLFTWLAMTLAALFILEVNLWLPKGSNIISMAQKTLGLPGQIFAWISYLFLLYCLICAYIDGGGDVIHSLLSLAGLPINRTIATIAFVLIFATIIYSGIRIVARLNSHLMLVKLSIYFLLLLLISPHVNLAQLSGGHLKAITGAAMIVVTSFGFAIIVPSLRDYFDDHVDKLRRAILIGSLFPLVCYIAWDAIIMGVIPAHGSNGLIALLTSPNSTSRLASSLEVASRSNQITHFFRFFSTICILTAFLGVSLSLFDFLADGLKLKKKGWQGWLTTALVFGPPLAIVLFSQGIYVKAFAIAGFFCVALLLLLPAAMVASGRYRLHLKPQGYQAPGGWVSVLFVLLASVVILILSLVG